MTRELVLSKLHQIYEDSVGEKRSLQEDTLIELDLGLDSLNQIELMLGVETGFNLDFSDEETEKLRTIGDIIDLVLKYKGTE